MRSTSWSSWCLLAALSVGFTVTALACGSDDDDSKFDDGSSDAGDSGTTRPGFETDDASNNNNNNNGDGGNGQIVIVLRDFRLYNAGDNTTVPDFENPPYDINQQGQPQQGYAGDWNDTEIVTDTLGADNKPVYKNTSGKTLTTHSAADFAKWYKDIPGTNLRVEMPLVTTPLENGSFEYDSNKTGQLYDKAGSDAGLRGFFPLDDGEPLATAPPFGNQGKPHNFCFTGEIHVEFTYRGNESFTFRGDDDVWVYINKKRAINLGGIHGPKDASVDFNALGLVVGQTYPLDFFFAERHEGGSNLLFQTTLAFRPVTVK